MALDYGRKRTGIAVSDPLQLIANGLTTVPTKDLFDFLKDYFSKETVDKVVVGLPRQMNGRESESMPFIRQFVQTFARLYPHLPIDYCDERYTSKLAQMAMIQAGVKKKDRQNKALTDEVSATIILQTYMESDRSFKHLNQP